MTPTLFVPLMQYRPDGPRGEGVLRFVAGRQVERKSIVSHLSPVDAVLDAFCGNPSEAVLLMRHPEELEASKLRPIFGDELTIELACGFQARDGRLLIDEIACWQRYHLSASVTASLKGDHPEPKLTHEVEREIRSLFESAGLFAWEETAQTVHSTWDGPRMERAMCRAIQSIRQTEQGDGVAMNQIALFDPEAETWHFVPHVPADIAPYA